MSLYQNKGELVYRQAVRLRDVWTHGFLTFTFCCIRNAFCFFSDSASHFLKFSIAFTAWRVVVF